MVITNGLLGERLRLLELTIGCLKLRMGSMGVVMRIRTSTSSTCCMRGSSSPFPSSSPASSSFFTPPSTSPSFPSSTSSSLQSSRSFFPPCLFSILLWIRHHFFSPFCTRSLFLSSPRLTPFAGPPCLLSERPRNFIVISPILSDPFLLLLRLLSAPPLPTILLEPLSFSSTTTAHIH